jgi:hypothetical protein
MHAVNKRYIFWISVVPAALYGAIVREEERYAISNRKIQKA